MVYEMVMGMSEIKINNAQQARISIWKRLVAKANKLHVKSVYIDYYMSNGVSLIGRLRDIILTGFCALLVVEGEMTLGTMMMISFLLGQLAAPINDLLSFTKNVQDAKLSCIRLNDIFDRVDESHDESIDLQKEKITVIRFVDASFRYSGLSSPYVLQNICVDIQRGKTTAIVGTSGSGKTTLLKLMLGYYSGQPHQILLYSSVLVSLLP